MNGAWFEVKNGGSFLSISAIFGDLLKVVSR
jgi:hypothetical protein